MARNPQFTQLWKVVRDVLLLSHGQADVERGFSVNRQVEADNLSQEGFVARRTICDHVAAVGGLQHVDVSFPSLIVAAASARQLYQQYLDKQRQEEQAASTTRKRKAQVDEKMSKLPNVRNAV